MNSIGPLFFVCLFIVYETLPNFIYHNDDETVELIKKIIENKEKGAYLRIGDGDTALAAGLNSGTHQNNRLLQQEAKKVLLMEGKNIIKTLPLDPHVYQKTTDTQDSYLNTDRVNFIIQQALPLWGSDKNVYSATFLSHYAVTDITKCINFLKYLKTSSCSLLIGNKNIPPYIKNLLFGTQCDFIPTPPKNAFIEINKIEQEMLRTIEQLDSNSYHIIIVSAGNTGRILIRRLYNRISKNVFFFDFGSLMDAICGFESRIWIRTYFNRQSFLNQLNNSLR